MKFLIFALVFAFILEDHRIFPAKTIDQCSSDEQIELFKKYALELVSAAAKPLRTNGVIMEGGSKCILGIDMNEKADFIDALVATLSLAKDHHDELQLIQETSDYSKAKSNDGFMKSIHLILIVLESSPDIFDEFDGIQTLKRYLVKKKRNPSVTASGSSESDRISHYQPEIECYRSILSMKYENNKHFFDKLVTGFTIGNALMHADSKGCDKDPTVITRRARLDNIIKQISENENVLRTPPADYEKNAVERFIKNLLTKSKVSDFEFDTETDSD